MKLILLTLLIFSSNAFGSDWKPSLEMEDNANEVFRKYFEHIHSSNFKSSYSMHTKMFREQTSFPNWKKHKSIFIKDAGNFILHDDIKTTWYKDPENAPKKGIYSAKNYNCKYQNLQVCAGTLILYSKDGLKFEVMREEINSINKDAFEGLIKQGVIDESKKIIVKPFSSAKISKSQWESYYAAVNILFSNSKQVVPQQGLEIFTDKKSGTMFSFTLEGHPAYPSWITRYVFERNGSVGIGQTGYFAGEEEPFALLYRQYQELNAKAGKSFQGK